MMVEAREKVLADDVLREELDAEHIGESLADALITRNVIQALKENRLHLFIPVGEKVDPWSLCAIQ